MAIGTAAAILGGAAISAIAGSRASHSAANAQASGAQAGISEQRRQYDISRADLAPWRQAGAGALGTLARDFGTSFKTSPGYNFVRQEGQRDLGNSFASRGGAFSGNALKALDQYNTGLASQEYNNWWNRGAGLAGIGQNATNAGVMAGQNSAANISNLLGQQGDARASGIMGGANSITNALNSGLNNWLLYNGGYFGGGGGASGGGGGFTPPWGVH